MDSQKQRSTFNVRDRDTSPNGVENRKPLPRDGKDSTHFRSRSLSPTRRSPESFPESVAEALKKASPRPSILRHSSKDSEGNEEEDNRAQDEFSVSKKVAQRTAETKAQRLSRDLGIQSAPGSKYSSPVSSPPPSPPPEEQYKTSIDFQNIPLEKLQTKRSRYGIEDETESEVSDRGDEERPDKKKKRNRFHKAARRLIDRHTTKDTKKLFKVPAMSSQSSLQSGQVTPEVDRDPQDYVPKPKEFREGVLSSLLRLYNEQGIGAAASQSLEHVRGDRRGTSGESLPFSDILSPGRDTPEQRKATGIETPRRPKWYDKEPSPSLRHP